MGKSNSNYLADFLPGVTGVQINGPTDLSRLSPL